MEMRGGVRWETITTERTPVLAAPGVRCRLFRVFSGLRTERGQALVEFAFVGPLLLLFILVVVDFGMALDHREVLQHAVREGARRGAVGDTVAQITDQIHDQSPGTLDPSDITICYVDKNGDGQRGDPGDNVRVKAKYTYKFSVGGGEALAAFGVAPPSIDMSPVAEERLEKEAPNPIPC